MLQEKVKSFAIAFLLLFVVAIFAGCNSQSESATKEPVSQEAETKTEKRIVKHAMGETKVPADPKRVVLLEYFLDPIVALEEEVIAVPSAESWAGYDAPDYLKERHEGELTFIPDPYEINIEQIMSLQPDLIIGYKGSHDKIYEDLSKIAPTVIVSHEWGNFRESVREFGKIFGKEEKAELVIKEYDQKVAEAREKIKDIVDGKEVMFLRINNKAYRVYGEYGQIGRLLYEDLGMSIMKNYPKEEWSQDLTMEGLFVFNPDIIFLMTNSGEGPQRLMEELEKSHVWNNLEAVKSEQIYRADNFMYYGMGPIGSSILVDQIVENLTGE